MPHCTKARLTFKFSRAFYKNLTKTHSHNHPICNIMLKAIKTFISSLSNCFAVNHLNREHMICHWKQITIPTHLSCIQSIISSSLELPQVARKITRLIA